MTRVARGILSTSDLQPRAQSKGNDEYAHARRRDAQAATLPSATWVTLTHNTSFENQTQPPEVITLSRKGKRYLRKLVFYLTQSIHYTSSRKMIEKTPRESKNHPCNLKVTASTKCHTSRRISLVTLVPLRRFALLPHAQKTSGISTSNLISIVHRWITRPQIQ